MERTSSTSLTPPIRKDTSMAAATATTAITTVSRKTLMQSHGRSSQKSMQTRSAKSKAGSSRSQHKTISLRSTLPPGSLEIFMVRRVGLNDGISNTCPFCDEPPPMAEPWRRRRWQMAHLAVVHVKGELPSYQRTIEGETPVKVVKTHSNGNGHKKLRA